MLTLLRSSELCHDEIHSKSHFVPVASPFINSNGESFPLTSCAILFHLKVRIIRGGVFKKKRNCSVHEPRRNANGRESTAKGPVSVRVAFISSA